MQEASRHVQLSSSKCACTDVCGGVLSSWMGPKTTESTGPSGMSSLTWDAPILGVSASSAGSSAFSCVWFSFSARMRTTRRAATGAARKVLRPEQVAGEAMVVENAIVLGLRAGCATGQTPQQLGTKKDRTPHDVGKDGHFHVRGLVSGVRGPAATRVAMEDLHACAT